MHASDKEGTKMTYEQGSSVRVDIKQFIIGAMIFPQTF